MSCRVPLLALLPMAVALLRNPRFPPVILSFPAAQPGSSKKPTLATSAVHIPLRGTTECKNCITPMRSELENKNPTGEKRQAEGAAKSTPACSRCAAILAWRGGGVQVENMLLCGVRAPLQRILLRCGELQAVRSSPRPAAFSFPLWVPQNHLE